MSDPLLECPQLVASEAGFNIVSIGGRFYRVPQRLGTMCLELKRDRNHPKVRTFMTAASALSSITLRDHIRYPFWRARIYLRDLRWLLRHRLTGWRPPVSQKRCPCWDRK